jgi:hypothetical protein
MKTKSSLSIYLGILLLFLIILNSQRVFAQTADSAAVSSSTSGGAIQFQLVGGIGVYYIGDWSPASRFRVGADVSWNHSNQSGSNTGYSIYAYVPPSSSSAYGNTSQPGYNTQKVLLKIL